MIASFHCLNSVDVFVLKLKSMLRATHSCSAIIFRIFGWMPPMPGDLSICSWSRHYLTSFSLTSNDVSTSVSRCLGVICGILVVSSLADILKYCWFSTSAASRSLFVSEPSSFRSCLMPTSVFVMFLTYFQIPLFFLHYLASFCSYCLWALLMPC